MSDLSFFALATIVIGMEFAVQLKAPPLKTAGVHQAVLGILALLGAGLIGKSIEPLVGSMLFLSVVFRQGDYSRGQAAF